MGMKPVTRPPRALAAVGIALISTVLIAACSAGGSPDASSSGGADLGRAGSQQGEVEGAAGGAAFDEGSGSLNEGSNSAQANLAIATPSVIRVGAVILESDDVGDVVAQVEALAASVGGGISNEETYTDTDGNVTRSRLTLKVPVDTFDDSLDQLAEFGDLVSKTSDEEDVTAKVADVNSRVKSATESIDQLRRLFAQARKLADIITLERELSIREADLEALQAQQRALTARTTMSTITVNISLPDEEQASIDEDQAGFIAGLKSGWDGLVSFVIGAAHVLGLVLPLGALALLLGLIGWIAVRRLIPRRAAPASE